MPILAADSTPLSTVITCTLCPAYRIVRADRVAAWTEARAHAKSHGRKAMEAVHNGQRVRGEGKDSPA